MGSVGFFPPFPLLPCPFLSPLFPSESMELNLLGGNNALDVVLGSYRGHAPVCRGTIRDQPTAIACRAVLDDMEVSSRTQTWGPEEGGVKPDVGLPAVVSSRKLIFTLIFTVAAASLLPFLPLVFLALSLRCFCVFITLETPFSPVCLLVPLPRKRGKRKRKEETTLNPHQKVIHPELTTPPPTHSKQRLHPPRLWHRRHGELVPGLGGHDGGLLDVRPAGQRWERCWTW